MNDDKYLRIKQVSARTGLSRATIYNMMSTGSFPMKTALGVRAVGWLESEISAWMGDRKNTVKIGREARPGRIEKSKSDKKLPVLNRVAPANVDLSCEPSQVDVTAKTLEDDGWGRNEPPPTEEQVAAIKLRLTLANRRPKASSMGVVQMVRRGVQPK